MATKESKLTESVKKYRSLILEGSLLSVDPASGGSSYPGYAIFDAGVLMEYGTIDLPKGQDIHLRLQELCRTLRDEFIVPDVLVVENIPPFMSTAVGDKKNFANRAVINLHKSIGCIVGSVRCKALVEVTPGSWRQMIPEDYLKSDENDALMLGLRVLKEAYDLSSSQFPDGVLEKYINIVRAKKPALSLFNEDERTKL